MRRKKIKTFYNVKQVCFEKIEEESYSKSPLKPYLLVKKIRYILPQLLEITSNFKPFEKEDFFIAHTEKYVNDVFKGKDFSNGLPYSKELINSLRYTNSSLYNSILYSIKNPDTVTFSPTSGFHHASPNNGCGFCTFSGQVISSIKIYNEFNLVGCYFDLDGHFGNSIEDSRKYVKDLNNAIPLQCNINPYGNAKQYLDLLKQKLQEIEQLIIDNKVHYIVWCHGADSHIDDDLRSGRLNTKQWLECSNIFYSWLKNLEIKLNKHIPLCISLFGGYRKNNYDFVLNLHINDLIKCSNILLNNKYKILK